MKQLKAFGAFWYDFIIGDDWRVALGVVAALALTWWIGHSTSAPSWWLLPVFVAVVLPYSLYRVTRKGD